MKRSNNVLSLITGALLAVAMLLSVTCAQVLDGEDLASQSGGGGTVGPGGQHSDCGEDQRSNPANSGACTARKPPSSKKACADNEDCQGDADCIDSYCREL